MSERAPDILFVIADDWSAYHTGPGGCAPVATPNLDRLRARGVTFLNAHCPAPLCGPSRAAALTGIAPWRSGLCGYNQQQYPFRANPVLAGARTFVEDARACGYVTLGTGKIFHNGHEDDTVWTEQGAAPSFGPIAWDGVDTGSGGWLPHPDLPPPLNEDAPHAWDLSYGPLSAVPRFRNAGGNPRGADGWSVNGRPWHWNSGDDRDAMPDEVSVRWAAERLRSPPAEPQLLAVGLNRPHTPLHVPDEYFERIPPESVDLPGWDGARTAPVLPALRRDGMVNTNVGYERWDRLRAAGGGAVCRQWVRAYLASVAFADDQLGVLLDALEASPPDRKTVVVFTADHGYQLGERGYLFKNTLWEPSTRVPLIIAAESCAAGGTSDVPAGSLDLYPTLARLCGLDGPDAGAARPDDGKDLGPWLRDPAAAFPEFDGVVTVVPGEAPPQADGRSDPKRQHYALRTRRWRYIRAVDGSEALFDQAADPHAFEDLAADPRHGIVLEQLRAALAARLGLEAGP